MSDWKSIEDEFDKKFVRDDGGIDKYYFEGDEQDFMAVAIKTFIFTHLAHERTAEHTRTLKERDDTAYAKGIIKGKEQAVKEIEGIIGKDDLPDIEHKHKYSLAWAPVRNIFRKELRKALSDILSVLKGGI
jgi:hypothetical protein